MARRQKEVRRCCTASRRIPLPDLDRLSNDGGIHSVCWAHVQDIIQNLDVDDRPAGRVKEIDKEGESNLGFLCCGTMFALEFAMGCVLGKCLGDFLVVSSVC